MVSTFVIRYVLTAAVRDRLVLSLLLLIIVGASIAVFIGSSAVVEADKFALVFASGGLRFAATIGVVLFVVFYVRRAFETKDVEYLLSRPISRPAFVVSHAIAFSIMAAILGLCITIAITMIAPHMFGPGHMIWGASLMAELVIMANVALFFSMVLSSASSGALAVFAMYILARLMGQLLGIIDQGLNVAGFELMSALLQIISLIVPRLDLMGQTSWLVYGAADLNYAFIVGQGIVYSAFIVAASVVDLVRRQF